MLMSFYSQFQSTSSSRSQTAKQANICPVSNIITSTFYHIIILFTLKTVLPSPLFFVNAITVGQAAQLWGYETTLNKLSLAMGNTLIAVRPYSGNFSIMEERYDEYGQFLRKISYFTDTFEASQDWNTVSNLNQLDDGNSIDHYKIRKRYPLEVWFNGHKVLQKHFTRFRKQLKVAFSNAEEFARFYEGELVQINNEIQIFQSTSSSELVQINNEIQMKKETGNRMITLNFILGCLFGTGYPDGMKRNLTAEFNTKFGTTYKTKDLLSTHLPEFTKFFASILKYQSDMMARPTTMFHATPTNQFQSTSSSRSQTEVRRTIITDFYRISIH